MQLLHMPVLLLLLRASWAQVDREWISVPGKLYACEGQDVIFDWQFNETYGTPDTIKGVLVTKKDPTITYLTKTGGAKASLPQGRTETHGNAGIKLLNVKPDDTANFECSVYFTEKHQVHNDASLKVYASADCPNEARLRSPRVVTDITEGGVMLRESQEVVYTQKNSQINLGVQIPKSKPPVTCDVSIGPGFSARTCDGSSDYDAQCWVNHTFTEAGHFNYSAQFSHIVFDDLEPTVIQILVKEDLESWWRSRDDVLVTSTDDVLTSPGLIAPTGYGTTREQIDERSKCKASTGLVVFCIILVIILGLLVAVVVGVCLKLQNVGPFSRVTFPKSVVDWVAKNAETLTDEIKEKEIELQERETCHPPVQPEEDGPGDNERSPLNTSETSKADADKPTGNRPADILTLPLADKLDQGTADDYSPTQTPDEDAASPLFHKRRKQPDV